MLSPHRRSGPRAGALQGRARRALFGSLLLALAGACTSTAAPVPAEPEEEPPNAFRVLFIGNSLTYTNDLPGILEALADSAGVARPLVTAAVAGADFSLEDHWNDGTAREGLRARAWHVVLMQQGPSSLPQNALHLAEWSDRWAAEIRATEARPGLYMVWPVPGGSYQAVSDAYRNAAEQIDGMLAPVGEAFREVLRGESDVALFLGDAFHPSPYGTYLAAIVMLAVLYDVEPVGLPRELRTERGAVLRVPAAEALVLQQAAAHAVTAFARR
jgi:hypothetical protein